ncbi:hypothetical protein H9P43_004223 [Blastocladiella emersonii ATCC 22665]|nr:hypothetical protein H9P43_004223 [Blastocladiella emersonii ATCC 22665]
MDRVIAASGSIPVSRGKLAFRGRREPVCSSPPPLNEVILQLIDAGVARPEDYCAAAAQLLERAKVAKAQWDSDFALLAGIMRPKLLWFWTGHELRNQFYGTVITNGRCIHALLVKSGMRPLSQDAATALDASLAGALVNWVGAMDSDGYADRLAAIGGALPVLPDSFVRGRGIFATIVERPVLSGGFQDPSSRDVHTRYILLPANFSAIIGDPGQVFLITARIVSASLIVKLQRLVLAYRGSVPGRLLTVRKLTSLLTSALLDLRTAAERAEELVATLDGLAEKLAGAQAGFDIVFGKARAHVKRLGAEASAEFKDQFIVRELERTLSAAVPIHGAAADISAGDGSAAPVHDATPDVLTGDGSAATTDDLNSDPPVLNTESASPAAIDFASLLSTCATAADGAQAARAAIDRAVAASLDRAEETVRLALAALRDAYPGDEAARKELQRTLLFLVQQRKPAADYALVQSSIKHYRALRRERRGRGRDGAKTPDLIGQLKHACRRAVLVLGSEFEFGRGSVAELLVKIPRVLRSMGAHVYLVSEALSSKWCAVCAALDPVAAALGECDLSPVPDSRRSACPRCRVEVDRDMNASLNLLMFTLALFIVIPAQPKLELRRLAVSKV